MKIEVTQADINAGRSAYNANNGSRPEVCPICQAIRRATSATHVKVYPGHEESEPVAVVGDFTFKLSAKAAKWAREFDVFMQGEPFFFSLTKQTTPRK